MKETNYTKPHTIMKEILSLYLNWRIDAILLLAALSLTLLVCDTTGTLSFVLTKAAGLVTGYVCWRLLKYWSTTGRLGDLDKLEK